MSKATLKAQLEVLSAQKVFVEKQYDFQIAQIDEQADKVRAQIDAPDPVAKPKPQAPAPQSE